QQVLVRAAPPPSPQHLPEHGVRHGLPPGGLGSQLAQALEEGPRSPAAATADPRLPESVPGHRRALELTRSPRDLPWSERKEWPAELRGLQTRIDADRRGSERKKSEASRDSQEPSTR